MAHELNGTRVAILAADGVTVEGVFCPCTETTEKIVSARRLEILRKLGAQPLRAHGLKAPAEGLCAVMSESRMDVPFCLIYRCGDGGTELLASTGVDAPAAMAPAAWPLDAVAQAHGATPGQIALAWCLKRSPVMLPIPGTGKVKHLEENVAAASIALTDEEFAGLDKAGREAWKQR